MSGPIISVSGLRGIVGETLTPHVAVNYAAAFAAELPPGPVVLTRDGRPSGAAIADLLRGALAMAGRQVIDGGIAATPTCGVLVREFGAAGGIQISASHNPSPYNGMKLFSAEGCVIDAHRGEHVLGRYQQGVFHWQPHDGIGSVLACEDTFARHLELVLARVDVKRIRHAGFRVLLDSNQGAGSLLGRRVLEELGCQVTLLGSDANGQFLHPAEPTAENLETVCRRVGEVGADVGFCQDPDADRLAVIDGGGKYLGEEYTLALCLSHVLAASKGPIVTNCSTSRMSQDLAAAAEVPCYLSKVGEANVVEVMREHEAVFGGEGNGGPIDPHVGYVRDSFVGMALLLDFMAAAGKPIAELAASLPSYAIHKAKAPLARDRLAKALMALKKHFADAKPDMLDGLRLDWPEAWLLVRASNTEPIVRIIAESHTAEESKRLCDDAAEVIAAAH